MLNLVQIYYTQVFIPFPLCNSFCYRHVNVQITNLHNTVTTSVLNVTVTEKMIINGTIKCMYSTQHKLQSPKLFECVLIQVLIPFTFCNSFYYRHVKVENTIQCYTDDYCFDLALPCVRSLPKPIVYITSMVEKNYTLCREKKIIMKFTEDLGRF